MTLLQYLLDNNIGHTATEQGITIGGYLDLRGTAITVLPDNLTVGGYLDLHGTAITVLPDNLTVGGSLDLRGTAITVLPDNLTVGGSLDLHGTAITVLPDNLTVGGYLDLRGTAITVLPDNLTVGGSLDLEGTAIEKVIYSDKIGSRNAVTTYAIQFDKVKCGCFSGTLQQFEERVHSVYPAGNQYRTDYDLYIQRCKEAVKSYTNGGVI